MLAVLEVVVFPHLTLLSVEDRDKTKTGPQGYCNTKSEHFPMSCTGKGFGAWDWRSSPTRELNCFEYDISEDTDTWLDGLQLRMKLGD